MGIIENVIEELRKFRYLGEQVLEDGTVLVGKAPHIAPNAWLHSIHRALNDGEILALETMLGLNIPEEYKMFLKYANGIKVFNTTFCLDGLRKNYGRSVNHVWQPFDIVIPNIQERPMAATSNMFFIGGYDWDGSLLYIDKLTDKVHLCDQNDARSVYQWENFGVMLSTEIYRLITLFDSNGREKDSNMSTLPTNSGASMQR